MTMAVTSPAPAPQGHCSQCGKVWTLNERQGICQWCKRNASCEATKAKPRHVKSNRRRKPTQANGNGNGYDQLPEPHLTYYNVALPFAKSVPTQDQEDLLHTIIANLINAGRNNGHKPDNPSWMFRIASFSKADYWRDRYKLTNGLTCCNCSKAQRRKCKEDWLYVDCPKVIKIESLNKPVIDGEGNTTELGELIADDKAIDLDAWVSDSTWEIGYPKRLVAIAYRLKAGIPLTKYDRLCLCRYRKREQKKLIG